MSIKVGNQTKRAVFYGGEKNLTKDEDMTIQVCFIIRLLLSKTWVCFNDNGKVLLQHLRKLRIMSSASLEHNIKDKEFRDLKKWLSVTTMSPKDCYLVTFLS